MHNNLIVYSFKKVSKKETEVTGYYQKSCVNKEKKL